MTSTLEEMDRLILEAVSNDFEQLDSVLEQILNWINPHRKIDRQEVENRLSALIRSGHVEAYLLRPSTPHFTEVRSLDNDLSTYWFYITDRGKEILNIPHQD